MDEQICGDNAKTNYSQNEKVVIAKEDSPNKFYSVWLPTYAQGKTGYPT